MSEMEFFIIPEIALVTGIILAEILRLPKKQIAESKGDISLGYLKKEDILKLSPNELKKLRKALLTATGCMFFVTAFIALVPVLLGEINILSLILCLVAQVISSVICGMVFMKRIKSLTLNKV